MNMEIEKKIKEIQCNITPTRCKHNFIKTCECIKIELDNCFPLSKEKRENWKNNSLIEK